MDSPETAGQTATPVDLTKQRDDVCIPIAKAIIDMVSSKTDLAMGQVTKEAEQQYYNDFIVAHVLPLLTEKNIKTFDATYIMALAFQPFENVKNYLLAALEDAEDGAVAVKFGVSTVRDIRIMDIIGVQQNNAKGPVGDVVTPAPDLSTGTGVAPESTPA